MIVYAFYMIFDDFSTIFDAFSTLFDDLSTIFDGFRRFLNSKLWKSYRQNLSRIQWRIFFCLELISAELRHWESQRKIETEYTNFRQIFFSIDSCFKIFQFSKLIYSIFK